MAVDRVIAPPPPPAPLSAPVFQILLSLVDEDLHGYASIQDVAARTGGEVRRTASTLYAAVQRLLTQPGRAAARAEARRIDGLAAMARAKRLLAPAANSPERA